MTAPKTGSPAPPAVLEAWLRRRLAARPESSFVIGDLREEHAARVARGGRCRAALWYLGQVGALGHGRAARPARRPRNLTLDPLPGPRDMLASILLDIRYGLRSLRQAPVFTLAALLTLALGIGANAAIFSLVNAVLLRSLPYPEADRLVRVYSGYPERDIRGGTLSPDDFQDWRAGSRTLEAMTVFPNLDIGGLVLTGGERPVEVRAEYVGEGFFATLGTSALLGRAILDADQAEGDNAVVVLSHRTWASRYGSDPGIVGQTIVLSDRPFRVIGVMPPEFAYPSPADEMWVPLSLISEDGIPRRRSVRFLAGLARLAPGADIERARQELSAIARRLASEYPDSNAQLTEVEVVPLHDQLTGGARIGLLALLAAVGVVLLTCCANVAGLMLVRAQGRSRELAVRAALGAGRGRLARQLLTESTLLATIGGGLGLALGSAALRSLVAIAPAGLPRLSEVGVDPTVVAFALGLSLLTGLLFGLAPAWRAWRGDLQTDLKLAGGAEMAGRNHIRGLLVMAEVALVVVLAIAAGLLLRTLDRLLDIEPGFAVEGALAMQVDAPSHKLDDGAEIARYFESVLAEVRAQPGVVAAGVVRPMPLTVGTFEGEGFGFTVVGEPAPPAGQEPTGSLRFVSSDAFRALGIPMREGRGFDARDDAEAGVLRGIVNESLVRRFFPDGTAVGRRLAAGGGEIEVVGVVGDIRQTSLDGEVGNIVYAPISQLARLGMTLVVRVRGEPAARAAAVQEAIWRVDPDQPIGEVTTLDALVHRSVGEERFSALLIGLFAALALTIATVGIYGVVASAVAQRSQEIGIRMALGAHRGAVTRWVVGQGMSWVAAGIVLGLVAALAVSRLLGSLLYGVAAHDPPTYLAVAALLGAVAAIASLVPARRAVAIDPVRALRAE